uniref:Ribonuclease H-like domain-containing protein n=1 Tax=Tanacetum cinerariifolium TaxID=118510 RepID=A0A6L2M1G5_TANCI|nr:ribonuclease H-like domain-containing protein [Tanacetum cinerariifolium]
MATKIKDQDLEISRLKARVKSLKDKNRRSVEPTQKDAPITRGIIEIREELGAEKSIELGNNNTEEMVNVLSSMEAANILISGVTATSVSTTAGVSAAGVPTVSGSFPTVSAIFTTASMRKLQEQIDAQAAKEMKEEFARENKRTSSIGGYSLKIIVDPVTVIEFGDSYKAPPEETGKGPASESSAKKKGRIVVITTKDMQKRRNDVKARTTLLLALPDENQLRFSMYETAKELWEAILKNFGSKTLEQTINRLQAIMSHLEFMDVEIEQDDLNQKFLTSLASEWLMYTIVWRNRDDLDTMSLDDVYSYLKVYKPKVQKKSESNSQNMAFISSSNTSSGKGEVHTASVPTTSTQVSTASTNVASASLSHDTVCAYIASQSNGSQIKYEDITQIDEDDIEEIDIK